jgi:putative pyruvate formate lyase activating enzyme
MSDQPSYIDLYHSGRLKEVADILIQRMNRCDLCPHHCWVNRNDSETGICHSGCLPAVSSYCHHYGEEPPLVGRNGVGNIFFGNCNLKCVYCQNHQISQDHDKQLKYRVSTSTLADIMIRLQSEGCHSIGLVTPTHFVAPVVQAVYRAVEKGLNVPLIYNTNAYDCTDVLKLLEGIFDIYLPDIKYSDDRFAAEYSSAINYTEISRSAIREMYRQTGYLLHYNESNAVQRGLIIRHLILPENKAGSYDSLKWIAEELHPCVSISLMSQYYPTHLTWKYPEIHRPIMDEEYNDVINMLNSLGLHNGWIQDLQSHDYYRPDFGNQTEPFST